MDELPRTCEVEARCTFEGWHRWPTAPPHRSYLRASHRHLFHVEARVHVLHDDRQVECHDLRELVLEALEVASRGGDFGTMSCEQIASYVADHLHERLAPPGWRVAVYEDGEVGAIVSWIDPTHEAVKRMAASS